MSGKNGSNKANTKSNSHFNISSSPDQITLNAA